MTDTKILNKILQNRERRFALRQAMTAKGLASVSLNFNVPSYPKSSASLRKAFACVQKDLQRFCISKRIQILADYQEVLQSDCGDFYLQGVCYPFEDEKVKQFLEEFEQTHFLGRILDVDLVNVQGGSISSGKAKKCFLCDEPARECMKAERHAYTESRAYIAEQVDEFLRKQKGQEIVAKLTELAVKATLFEVAVEQKPGLVCPSSNGSHTDMDYFTFLSSSAALATYWQQVAEYGYEFGNTDLQDFIPARERLRVLGVQAEERMFAATQGVNTQKGIVFLLGIAVFASATVFAKKTAFDTADFRNCVRKLMSGVVDEDLSQGRSQQHTHGEVVFQKYGKQLAGGARFEAEEAFPAVFEETLPFLRTKITKQECLAKQDWQEILLDLLLLLIAESNDINILYRKDEKTLKTVQEKAKNIHTCTAICEKQKSLQEFSDYCVLHNISSGGAADLLALSMFIYFIQDLNF